MPKHEKKQHSHTIIIKLNQITTKSAADAATLVKILAITTTKKNSKYLMPWIPATIKVKKNEMRTHSTHTDPREVEALRQFVYSILFRGKHEGKTWPKFTKNNRAKRINYEFVYQLQLI